jgi:hypothetical protein
MNQTSQKRSHETVFFLSFTIKSISESHYGTLEFPFIKFLLGWSFNENVKNSSIFVFFDLLNIFNIYSYFPSHHLKWIHASWLFSILWCIIPYIIRMWGLIWLLLVFTFSFVFISASLNCYNPWFSPTMIYSSSITLTLKNYSYFHDITIFSWNLSLLVKVWALWRYKQVFPNFFSE